MTIAQAREAAKRLLIWHSMPYSCGSKVGKELADFILDHFPEDGDDMVTEEWLREEWGFTYAAHGPGMYLPFTADHAHLGLLRDTHSSTVWWMPGFNDGKISIRHQARQLFQALGIKKRGEA